MPATEIVGRLTLSARHPMDIIAYALWTTAAAKLARDRTHQPLGLKWAAVWGVFPEDAAAAQKKVLAGVKTISLARTFHYLERKLAGKKARRPQPRSWRASK